MLRNINLGLVLVGLLGTAGGCTPASIDSIENAVTVQGKLTQRGIPLSVAGREIGTGMVSLTFIPTTPIPGGEQTFGTSVDENGMFNMPGGMPAGEYRVVIEQWEPYPETDKLAGKYNARNTPLKIQVTGTDPIEIDLE